MPFTIVNNDITAMRVDCVVSSTNPMLQRMGTGVEDAIHRAAGPALQEALDKIAFCPYGSAVITDGYGLSARHIIHAVGPVWNGGSYGEKEQLRETYRGIFRLADKYDINEIALPVLCAGAYRFPKAMALSVAREEIRRFLDTREDAQVYLVVYNRELFRTGTTLFDELDSYLASTMEQVGGSLPHISPYLAEKNCLIEETACPDAEDGFPGAEFGPPQKASSPEDITWEDVHFRRSIVCDGAPRPCGSKPGKNILPVKKAALQAPQKKKPETKAAAPAANYSLTPRAATLSGYLSGAGNRFDPEKGFATLDKGFAEMVLYWIEAKGMSDPECYKASNISKAVFNKLKKGALDGTGYNPKKYTAMAFAVGLQLDMEQANDLLMRAGYVFSTSIPGDMIVAYFISRKNYNMFEINEALYDHDQVLLGSI